MKTASSLLMCFCVFMFGPPVKAQVLETHNFTSINKAIPDGNASGLSSVQRIDSAIQNLTSLRVKVRIAGQFNGDLYGYLRQIEGRTNFCVLLNRVGRTATNSAGYADAGFDVTFDDSAVNGDIHLYRAITNPPPGTPLSGTWQPDGRRVDPSGVLDATSRTTTLGSFAGSEASGEWTLYLADLETGGTNMLASWGLEFYGPAKPAVTWPAPSDIVYGTALGSSQLNATSPVPGTFVYSPPAGTVLAAGSSQVLSVTFTPADSTSYVPISTNVTINTLKAPLAISAQDVTKLYGAALPAFDVIYTGFLNGDTPASLITPVVLTPAASASSPVGSYAITPGGASSANYTITYSPGTLTIGPAPLSIIALSTNKVYGAPLPAFGAMYSGFVNDDDPGSLTTPVNFTAGASAATPVGSYAITPFGATGSNYTISFFDGTLHITKAGTMVFVNSSLNPSRPGEQVAFAVTLSADAPGAGSPGGTVQFKIDGANAGPAVTVIGGTASCSATSLAVGTHTVLAEYFGDENFVGSTNALSPSELVDTPPVAVADVIERDPTNGVKVSIATLLSNDTDADGDTITFLSAAANSLNGGTVTGDATWVYYTPAPGFTNADSFTYTISDGRGAPVMGTVTVNIRVDYGPSPNLSITELGLSGYEIRGDGIPGRTYRIQFADNFDHPNWQVLGTATASQAGVFAYVDSQGSTNRFYRSVYP